MNVRELGIDKLKTYWFLSKRSNVVNNVVKKTVYDKLVTNVNAISNSGFLLKIEYSTDKSGYKNKIDDMGKKLPDTSGFVKKTDYKTSITDTEGEIPSILV